MKRHEALANLSREHHGPLPLTQLLKREAPPYMGLPKSLSEKVHFAQTSFRTHMKDHFVKEERMLQVVKGLNQELTNSPDIELMDRTGSELEQDIRKEERVLFPLIEESCSADLLRTIQSMFL